MDDHAPLPPVDCRRDHAARGVIRWVSNNNPFYAVSVVLVLIGLRMSFNPDMNAFPAWAFILGLAFYTILMAAMACVLVRLGNVWEDVRTLVLLIVVVFVGISMIFDDVLIRDRRLGWMCDVGAAIFAIVLSEATLLGMRLRLPALYRIPYYLGLALIFLYPAALVPLLDRPGDPNLPWGLFGFSLAAGVIALLLLPAIRRGPGYVSKNGSPWRWPLYPWALFVVLGLGLVARAASLCWSMQAPAFPELSQSVFRPYFLVPMGLAASVVLLELGLVTGSRMATRLGLAIPGALMVLAVIGHGAGVHSVSGRFLGEFTTHLGGTPLYLTLLLASIFYMVASLRRVPSASIWLTLGIASLAVVGPETLTLSDLSTPRSMPLWAASAVQAMLAIQRPTSARWMVASGLAALAAGVGVGPMPPVGLATSPILGLNLTIVCALVIGAVFRDRLARLLQMAGLVALTLASLGALALVPETGSSLSRAIARAYPLVAAMVAVMYGFCLKHRLAMGSAGVSFLGWLLVVGGRGYVELRLSVAGLDQISLGLGFFALAALVSLAKAGVLSRRPVSLRQRVRQPPSSRNCDQPLCDTTAC